MPAEAKEVQVVLTFKDDGSYDIKKVVQEINTTLQQAGVSAQAVGTGFQKMSKQVVEADSGLSKLRNTFKSTMFQMAAGLGIWTGFSQVVGWVTRNLRDVIVQGRMFEEAFTKVRVVLHSTERENEAVRQTLLRMNPALGSAVEMTRALAVAMREFKEASRAEQFRLVETAAKTAVAGYTSTETALDALTTVVKGYKLELGDAARVGEVLVRATQIENVQFEQLARSLTKLGATAKQVGVAFPELVGAFLTLQERQDPQLALMQLRMLLTNLMKPSTAAQRAAKQLGIEWSAAGIQAMGFVNWLKKLNQVTAGSSEVLDNLIPGGRQMIGMLELVGNNAKETSQKVSELTKAWNEGGAVAQGFQARLHSTSFILDTLKEIFSRFKIAIFQGFSAPLLAGIANQEQFEKKIKELTDKAVDFGTKVGKAIYDVIQTLVKLSGTIKTVATVWATFWAAKTVGKIGDELIGKINASSSSMAGLKLASMGVIGALQKLLMVVAAFKIGWDIGKWINDVTGLRKAVMTTHYGVTKEMEKETSSMLELRKTIEGTGISVVQLRTKYGSYGAALEAVKQGLDEQVNAHKALVEKHKEEEKVVKSKITYQNALRQAMDGTLQMTKDSIDSLDELTDEQKQNIIETNRAREEMKKYGFSFRTDILESYNALKRGLQLFRKEMTADDYEKLRKALRSLAGDLGLASKSLERLGVLTKEEVNIEMKKQFSLLADLRASLAKGEISWDQYQKGLERVTSAFQQLDSTMTATWQNVKRLGVTPLPAPKILGPVPQPIVTTPTAGPLLSLEEIQKGFEKIGPSVEYLRYLESQLGAPLRELARRELPLLEASFKVAMSSGGYSTENLKKAAETLIQKYKDAGEKVPKWLRSMGSSVDSVWSGVTQTMVSYWTNAMGEMIQSGLNFRDVINVTWQTLAALVGQVIGNMVQDALSSLGSIAGPIGGLVGSIAGSLVSVVGKLIGIKSKAQKEAEEAKVKELELKRAVESVQKSYSEFGKISESTAKKIVEMRKETNYATAAIRTLNDVMNDVGITTKNVSLYIKEMTNALYNVAHGLVQAEDAVQAIGQAFTSLINWAQRFGQEGSKTLTDFIKKVRSLGVSIKEIDDYVYSQLGRAVGGLQAMISAFGGTGYQQLMAYKEAITSLGAEVEKLSTSRLESREEQQDYLRKKNQLKELVAQYESLRSTFATELGPELERIGNLTVATFNAILEQSGSMVEAFGAIAEPLAALRERYQELGLTGGAAIQELLKISEVEEANKGLFNAIEGNRQVLNALGNTGFLTAEAMMDTATQVQSYYDKLLGTGLNANQALAMLSPTLADLEYYAKQYGITLDDNTRMLIEQSKIAGLFKERGRDVASILEDAFPNIFKRLDELVEQGRRREGKEQGGTTRAQQGFYGTVTGPRSFYIEPGVTETVHISKPGTVSGGTTIIEKPVVMEPVVIPFKELQAFVIEWVQKAGNDERVLFRPRSVRGGKG